MRSSPFGLIWLWGPGFLHSWRVGLAKPGERAQLEGLWSQQWQLPPLPATPGPAF